MTATRSIATTLAIALLCACNQEPTTTTQDTAAPKAAAGVAHPELWPKSASPDFKDAETEAFVSELMAKMSLEEKVGQMIQGDIASVTPGGSAQVSARLDPGRRQFAAAGRAATVRRRSRGSTTARAFRAVSLEQRDRATCRSR